VRHHGGAVYVANTCHRHDKRLSWNNTGPRGATGASGTPGAPGTPGATGDQGIPGPPGPVDTSQLVHGAGSVSAFGLVTVANGHGAVLKDVPGVGKLDVMSCSASSQNLRFTNTSAVTAHVVISTDTNGAANWPDAHGVAGLGVNIGRCSVPSTRSAWWSRSGPRPSPTSGAPPTSRRATTVCTGERSVGS
jgi:hypothetical protein